jgi:hypothetical protein
LFLVASFAQPLQHFWVQVSFELNRTYIARNLCENRAKPELKCGGQCYLMKKLAEKKQEQEKDADNIEVSLVVPLLDSYPVFDFLRNSKEVQDLFLSSLVPFCTQSCILSIFHHPCA